MGIVTKNFKRERRSGNGIYLLRIKITYLRET